MQKIQKCVVPENVHTTPPQWKVFFLRPTHPPHPLGISVPGGILVPPLELPNF